MDRQTEQYLLQRVERLDGQVRSISRELNETIDTVHRLIDKIVEALDTKKDKDH